MGSSAAHSRLAAGQVRSRRGVAGQRGLWSSSPTRGRGSWLKVSERGAVRRRPLSVARTQPGGGHGGGGQHGERAEQHRVGREPVEQGQQQGEAEPYISEDVVDGGQ